VTQQARFPTALLQNTVFSTISTGKNMHKEALMWSNKQ